MAPPSPPVERNPAGTTGGNNDFVCQMLAESEARITAAVQRSNAYISRSLQTEMHCLFKKFDANLQAQLQARQNEIHELRKIATEAMQNVDRIWTEISSLQGGLASSASVDAADRLDKERSFADPADMTCVVIQTKGYVDHDGVVAAVAPWLREASLEHEKDWFLG